MYRNKNTLIRLLSLVPFLGGLQDINPSHKASLTIRQASYTKGQGPKYAFHARSGHAIARLNVLRSVGLRSVPWKVCPSRRVRSC